MVLTCLFACIACVIVIFLATASVHRYVRSSGLLLPGAGLVRLASPATGIVAHFDVHDGDNVLSGQPLFRILTAHRTNEGGETEAQIDDLIRERAIRARTQGQQQLLQDANRLDVARRRERSLEADGRSLEGQIAMQKQRVRLAEGALARTRNLAESHFVATAQVDDRTSDAIDQSQRLEDLKRTKASVERDLDTARAEVADLEVQRRRDEEAEHEVLSTVEQARVENQAHRFAEVTAPGDGTISMVNAQAGQNVTAGQLLGTVSPAGSPLEAELYLSSRDIAFVKPGLPVLLQLRAFPYQRYGQFKAVIREVSAVAVRPDDVAESGMLARARLDNRPIYRVRATLEKQSISISDGPVLLKAGMEFDATIVLRRQRLLDWMFTPLLEIKEAVR